MKKNPNKKIIECKYSKEELKTIWAIATVYLNKADAQKHPDEVKTLKAIARKTEKYLGLPV